MAQLAIGSANQMSEYRPETLQKFLWQIDTAFFDPFNEPAVVGSPFIATVDAFRENLKSAIQVGSIPFTLANAAIEQQRWQQVLTAENILALKAGNDPDAQAKARANALTVARQKMHAELVNKEAIDERAKRTVSFIESVNEDLAAAAAAEELLRQVLVIIWGAFEVLANDIAVEVINLAPWLAECLQKSQRYKFSNIGFDKLKSHGFDISKKMGSFLFEEQPLDKLAVIREVYALLFKDPVLSSSLMSQDLWNLSQKRHLIVHRRGIVDAAYLARTSETTKIKSILQSSTDEIEMYLEVVRDVGLLIVGTASQSNDK